MTENDENELHRLCDMLREVHLGLHEGSPLREAVTKAGLGLSLAFIHGHRSEIEQVALGIGRPLDGDRRQHLHTWGIHQEPSLDS